MTKGVSPLVATVLLIVIVVSLVAMISGWLNSFITDTRETVTNRTDASVQCTGASMNIETVYANFANGTAANARVIVKNDGVADRVSIMSAQLYNTTGANFTTNTSLPVTNFPPGAITTLVFENVGLSSCSAFSQVVVSTQCSSARFKTHPEGC
ncbi:MAG: archaellin/type IV pilin N-terminal domain-containing protein [Candidatus Aenigmatarchaeota archaeon]